MQNNEFIAQVKQLAGIESADEALQATRAVLETLADHLAGNAPAKLAAQLSEEIGALITEHKSDPNADGEGFGVEEFLNRTANRAGLEDSETTKRYSIAVLAALRTAISDGEFDKMRGTLPAEYDELFGSDSSEHSNAA